MTVQTGFAAAGFGPAGKRKLEIRQVWAHNVEHEFALIRYAAEYFPYVSMDTEFPGVVHNPNPSKHHADLTPSETYAAVKANVDALHLIQVGLAFAASPNTPPSFAFQINLREFDQRVHPHAPASIDLLADHGLDFAAHRSHGVDARVFAALLMSSGLVCANSAVTWVTFSAGYDLGYLVKLLMGRKLPGSLPDFLRLVRVFFGERLYDVKHMLRSCPGLPGGLEGVAKALGVTRDAGMAHQAASDGALTWAVFRRLRDVYFAKAGVRGCAGVVYGLELHVGVAAAPAPALAPNSGNGANGYGGRNRHGSDGNGNGGRNRRGGNGNGNGKRNGRKVVPVSYEKRESRVAVVATSS